LIGGAENSLVREILGSLLTQVNLLRSMSLMHPNRLHKNLDEIDELLTYIGKRDPAGAHLTAKIIF
jgi:DNA-binding GntR family transcriptional regulator